MCTRPLRRSDHGFTLIELLVVVVIIGILAGIAVPVFMNQKARAHEAAVKAQVNTVAKSIETLFTEDTGTITGDSNVGEVSIASTTVKQPVKTTAGVRWGVGGTAAGYCIAAWSDNGGKFTLAAPLLYDSTVGGIRTSGACTSGPVDLTFAGSPPPVTPPADPSPSPSPSSTTEPPPVVPEVPITLAGAVLDAGEQYTCAVSGGKVYCWGYNNQGRTGIGTGSGSTTVPTAVTGLTGVTITKVVTGWSHTCAISSVGELYCWGRGDYGQIGDNGGVTRNAAVKVTGLLAGKTVTDVSPGTFGTCAVANAQAYCWGSNNFGQIGDSGTTGTNKLVPVLVTGPLAGKTVTEVEQGQYHSCAVANGEVYCWGQGTVGQIGNGTSTTSAQTNVTPIKVTSIPGTVTQLAAGLNYTCAISGGGLYCWGAGSMSGGTNPQTTPLLDVNYAGKTVRQVAAGDTDVCVIVDLGQACKGTNTYGAGGVGNTNNLGTPTPVSILGGKQVSRITVGAGHTCAIVDAGVQCWGYNNRSQLGDGLIANNVNPVVVPGLLPD